MKTPQLSGRWLMVAVGAITLMSTGAPIVKLASVDGGSLSVWRLAVGTVPYFIWALSDGDRPSWLALKTAAPGGALFGLNLLAFYSAAQLTSAANAVVIGALQPIVLLIAAGPLFGEWPPKSMYIWTAVAVAGVAISVNTGLSVGTGTLVGDGLAIVAMLTFAAYYLASKRARQTLRTPLYMALMQAVGLAVALPVVIAYRGGVAAPSTNDWWWILAMVVFPGTGQFLINLTHAHLSLSWTGLVGLLAPGLAAVFAWVLVREPVAWVQILGMAITVAALAMLVSSELIVGWFRLVRRSQLKNQR